MAEERWVVGVDLGGTNVVVGAVPVSGGPPVGLQSRPTEGEAGPEAVVERIARMVARTLEEVEERTDRAPEVVEGVGIGAPGPLDRASGIVVETPNLGWRDVPLREMISGAVDLPAVLDNDANCATYGEWWRGAGRGAECLVGLTLGTGIGGGVVLDGRIHHGASDVAGEVGHMTIDFTGRRCGCGNIGCLEAYASGPNIAARVVEALEAGEESVLPELVDDDRDRITAATVYEALVLGDRLAGEIMGETARILGVGVANLLNVLNPDVVVITGGVTRAGDHLFAPLRKEVRRRAFRLASDACRIVPGELPETAGVVGAAGVFRSERGGRRSDGGDA